MINDRIHCELLESNKNRMHPDFCLTCLKFVCIFSVEFRFSAMLKLNLNCKYKNKVDF